MMRNNGLMLGDRPWDVYGLVAVLVASLVAGACWPAVAETPADISIVEEERDDQPVYVIENDYYKTILAYTRARLPLSYVFKLTGHEQFKMPDSLSRPSTKFQYYGGIIDCIPWVGGPGVPQKGCLWSANWQVTTRRAEGAVVFDGRTRFEYKDPSTGEPCALAFAKTMTGYADSSRLKMDYRIENIGNANAKFELAVHSRIASGGKSDEGDYFYAPGNSCQVYYGLWPGVIRDDVKPPYWTHWPIEDAISLAVQKEPRRMFLFLPSSWSVVGDDKFKESLFFVSSPIVNAGRTHKMKMGIFATSTGYVVEPCATYRITSASWDEPEATLMLKPGETCSFCLDLVAYQGVELARIRELSEQDVISNCIVLRRPTVVVEGEKAVISAELGLPGKVSITVVQLLGDEEIQLKRLAAGPGVAAIELDFPKKAGVYALKLNDLSGSVELFQTTLDAGEKK